MPKATENFASTLQVYADTESPSDQLYLASQCYEGVLLHSNN